MHWVGSAALPMMRRHSFVNLLTSTAGGLAEEGDMHSVRSARAARDALHLSTEVRQTLLAREDGEAVLLQVGRSDKVVMEEPVNILKGCFTLMPHTWKRIQQEPIIPVAGSS